MGQPWPLHAKAGAQKVDEMGLGFNATSDEIKLGKLLHNWQAAGDEILWKAIISPEQGHRLDLKEHIRLVMKDVEKDLQTAIEWAAIDHYNTDNFHVHVVIRGIKPNGENLIIPKNYIKNGLRQRSCEQATCALGVRLEKDILERRAKVIKAKYITELDREINRIMIKYGAVSKRDFELADPINAKIVLDGEAVLKVKLLEIDSIKGSLLDPNNKQGIWKDVSSSKVRLKTGFDLKEEVIRDIAKGDFEKVFALIKQSQGLVKSGVLKQFPSGNLRLANQEAGRPQELADRKFDKIWNNLKQPYTSVVFIENKPDTAYLSVKRTQVVGRLMYLETLGLTKKESPSIWRVDPSFMDYLKFSQLQGDIIKSKNRHLDNIVDKDLPAIFNKIEKVGDQLVGRVVGMEHDERLNDTRVLLIEGIDGHIHYVPQTPRISRQVDAHEFGNGSMLFLERKEFIKDKGDGTVLKHNFDVQSLDFEAILPKLIQKGYVEENNKVVPSSRHLILSLELYLKTSLKINLSKLKRF